MHQKEHNLYDSDGFTLIEIVISVIMIMVLSGLVIPQYTGAIERFRAKEGVHALHTLRLSQERHRIDKKIYPNDLSDLDINLPTLKYFGTPTLSQCCTLGNNGICAQIARQNGYALTINCQNVISCEETPIPGIISCDKAGF